MKLLLGILLSTVALFAQAQWSMGYYSLVGSPQQTVDDIRWRGLTHIIYVSAKVNADGTLDLTTQDVTGTVPGLVTAAHANGVSVLVTLQEAVAGRFDSAVSGNLATLTAAVASMVSTYSLDGIDVNWEPADIGSSGANITALLGGLRTALGTKILTVTAMNGHQAFWGSNHANVDRVNVMTYDLSGTWNVTPNYGASGAWINSALYNPNVDSDGFASLNSIKVAYRAAGVPAAKLGLGLAFYGFKWTGGVLASDAAQGIKTPRQLWSEGNAPTKTNLYGYNEIPALIAPGEYVWDADSHTPYLSHDGGATQANYWYITYDNPRSIWDKVRYIKEQGLGGWIIWYLAYDYFPEESDTSPLMTAVADAMYGGAKLHGTCKGCKIK